MTLLEPLLLPSTPSPYYMMSDYDDFLEICVESLVGTIFEMRLSKMETVANIKLRLQRLEGIPRQQMHLLYRGSELPDSNTLAECSVETGSTLRLVLALRGGPINTRRVPVGNSNNNNSNNNAERQLQQMISRSREQLMDKMPKNGQVTVLLFREGDQVNLYHVLERPDGSFSPLSSSGGDSWSGGSIKNLFAEQSDPEVAERIRENAVTMNKVSEIKSQMESLSLKKKEKKYGRRSIVTAHREPSSSATKNKRKSVKLEAKNGHSFSKQRTQRNSINNSNNNNKSSNSIALPPIQQGTELNGGDDDSLSTSTSIYQLPPQTSSSAAAANYTRQSSLNNNNNNFNNSSSNNYLPSLKMETVPEWLQRNHSNFAAAKNGDDRDRSGSIDVIDLKLRPDESSVEILRTRRTQKLISTDVKSLMEMQRPVQGTRTLKSFNREIYDREEAVMSSDATSIDEAIDGDGGRKTPSADTLIDNIRPALLERRSNNNNNNRSISGQIHQLDQHEIKSPLGGNNNNSNNKQQQRVKSSGSSSRPVFRPASAASNSRRKKTPKPRCGEQSCRKKLNITNGFSCRCARVFCAKHRHPEVHGCTFDYKGEGRRALEKAIPVVTFPKLPKI